MARSRCRRRCWTPSRGWKSSSWGGWSRPTTADSLMYLPSTSLTATVSTWPEPGSSILRTSAREPRPRPPRRRRGRGTVGSRPEFRDHLGRWRQLVLEAPPQPQTGPPSVLVRRWRRLRRRRQGPRHRRPDHRRRRLDPEASGRPPDPARDPLPAPTPTHPVYRRIALYVTAAWAAPELVVTLPEARHLIHATGAGSAQSRTTIALPVMARLVFGLNFYVRARLDPVEFHLACQHEEAGFSQRPALATNVGTPA